MKHILLTPAQLQGDLTLAPIEDSLYILPPESTEVCLTLKLSHPGVRTFMVGLFHTTGEQNLHIKQLHTAPNTESRVLLKSLVAPESHFHYRGNVSIEKSAIGSCASQEARGLLMGEGARFQAFPSLEIAPKEVSCRHKASSAPLNVSSLFVLQTKGFSEAEAQHILESAFLKTAIDTMRTWNIPESSLEVIAKTVLKNSL